MAQVFNKIIALDKFSSLICLQNNESIFPSFLSIWLLPLSLPHLTLIISFCSSQITTEKHRMSFPETVDEILDVSEDEGRPSVIIIEKAPTVQLWLLTFRSDALFWYKKTIWEVHWRIEVGCHHDLYKLFLTVYNTLFHLFCRGCPANVR